MWEREDLGVETVVISVILHAIPGDVFFRVE